MRIGFWLIDEWHSTIDIIFFRDPGTVILLLVSYSYVPYSRKRFRFLMYSSWNFQRKQAACGGNRNDRRITLIGGRSQQSAKNPPTFPRTNCPWHLRRLEEDWAITVLRSILLIVNTNIKVLYGARRMDILKCSMAELVIERRSCNLKLMKEDPYYFIGVVLDQTAYSAKTGDRTNTTACAEVLPVSILVLK